MRYALDRSNAMHAFTVIDTAERYHKNRFERVREALKDQGKRRITSFEVYLKTQVSTSING